MRIRAVVAIVWLLLPAASSAQRMPMPRPRGPAGPAPLPAPPPSVARELAYKRLPVSFESYPIVSRFESSGFVAEGVVSTWTSFGMGTRIDYRVVPFLSATLDMTSSFLGGPARTQTIELGTRLRPERSDRRVYPFVDARVGFVHAYDAFLRPLDFVDPYGTAPVGPGTRYSQGFGGVGGAGVEFALTRMISLTTSASVLQTRMTTYELSGAGSGPASHRYTMTAYRYTLGVRFNPVRMMRQSATEQAKP